MLSKRDVNRKLNELKKQKLRGREKLTRENEKLRNKLEVAEGSIERLRKTLRGYETD